MTKGRKSLAGSAIELVVIVAVALGIALLVQAFLVKPYRIPSGSMLPTLHINQRVLVNRLSTKLGARPSVGDIVVFHPPASYNMGCANPHQGENDFGTSSSPGAAPCAVAGAHASTETFIKRVVGLPGDRISIAAGRVLRNGKPERDGYIAPCATGQACDFRSPITVPRDDYYMMGDNRGQSDDSRFWGPVPSSWLIGRAFFTYWPPDRVGFQ